MKHQRQIGQQLPVVTRVSSVCERTRSNQALLSADDVVVDLSGDAVTMSLTVVPIICRQLSAVVQPMTARTDQEGSTRIAHSHDSLTVRLVSQCSAAAPLLCDVARCAGRVVRTLDLRSTGRGFESWPLRCRVQSWASC